MLIVMSNSASQEDVNSVIATIEAHGWQAKPIPGGERMAIGILRNIGPVDPAIFLGMPGVRDAIPVSKPYKLVSREMKKENTRIPLGDGSVVIGGDKLILAAGPCAVESERQALEIACAVKRAGAVLFRAGAFKPRTSPYAFQGLGEKGLQILAKVRQETGLFIVSEATDHEVCDLVEEYADIIQIGTRNMQNYRLLKRAGQAKKPVLLKRGMSATIDEFFMAAEYILSEGNDQVILCERGIRTFATHSRNTLDLNAVPYIQKESHLPVFIDPSHAAGRRDQVIPLARAGAAVGASGLLIEVHNCPEKAMSDGPQSLLPADFEHLVAELRYMNFKI
jgi:3-deoxy-7-phosphoheptulonate synthase